MLGLRCAAVRGLAAALEQAGCVVRAELGADGGGQAVVASALTTGWELACDRVLAHGILPGRVLLLATPRTSVVLGALSRGLAGLVGPGEPLGAAVERVLAVARGESGVARSALLGHLGQAAGPAAPAFTGRQTEVLALTAHGRSVSEVAAALFVSPKTVRNTLSAVYGILGVSRRSEAVAWAWRSGWLGADRDKRPDQSGRTPRL